MRFRNTALVLVAVALGGCGSTVELTPRNAAAPAGVDLSGHWQLRDKDSRSLQEIAQAGASAVGGVPIIRSRRESKEKPARNSGRGLVHVFLETGSTLKVTQTNHGLFISFDRSVVEEYAFGEKRQVNVGPVYAHRVSGWEGQSYVIETLDDDGAILTERYRLQDDARVLVRDISVVKGEKRQLQVQQLFDRL